MVVNPSSQAERVRSGDAETATTLYLVAVEDYETSSESRHRAGLAERTTELAEVLSRGEGVRWAAVELAHGGTSDQISTPLSDGLAQASPSDRLILYWTGHGMPEGDGLYLLTRDSPAQGFDARNSVPARELASWLAKSPAEKILVVLDTCYSGQGAAEVAAALNTISVSTSSRPGQHRCVHVIGTAHAFDPRTSGVVSECLRDLLHDESSPHRRWGDGDRFIRCDDLTQALAEILAIRDVGSELVPKRDGYGDEFIPNPRYIGALPPLDVETKRRMLELDEHFLDSARGAEVDVTGWYFTGRRRVLDDLATWLATDEPGLGVVTGPPGAGKSAVIGRLVSIVHPGYHDVASSAGARPAEHRPLRTEPVVVHAKGRGRSELMTEIADQLDLSNVVDEPDDIEGFLDAIERQPDRVVIVIDALDEAAELDRETIASTLIVGLVERARCRVLVGCRRRLDGRTPPAGTDRHEQLRALFADADINDLADDANTHTDIVDYVTARLTEHPSAHADHPGLAEIAAAVADRADGSFLYARLVARTLMDAPDIQAEQLPATAVDALRSDLHRRLSDADARRGEAMLAALAWARGAGLTRTVWPAFAQAVDPAGKRYGQPDVAWALDHLGWHITETSEDGQTAYRLAHQSYADSLKTNRDPIATEARIVELLTAGSSGEGWMRTDRYIWRHLAGHAAAGAILERFLLDPGFLAVADPTRLVAVLRTGSRVGDSKLVAGVYQRCWRALLLIEPPERAALIHLAALQELPQPGQRTLVERLYLPAADLPGWHAVWAAWAPSVVHEILSGHTEKVRAVAIGQFDGRDVIVSGGNDHTVRVWTDPTGDGPPTVLTGHTKTVRAVAIGRFDGGDVIVSAGDDHTVRIWSDPSFAKPPTVLNGHTDRVRALTFGRLGGRDVIVSAGNDHTVRIWTAPDGSTSAVPFASERAPVWAVAAGPCGGKDVIAWAGAAKKVILQSTSGGKQQTFVDHSDSIGALALGTYRNRDVLVSGSDDRKVRIWYPTSRRDPTVLKGHSHAVTSVAIGRLGGEDVIVSASNDRTIRVWGPPDQRRPKVLDGSPDRLRAVALGTINGREVIVSAGNDDTVRVWDPPEDDQSAQPHVHDGPVWSVAAARIGGRDLIASAGNDHSVRVWDPLGETNPLVFRGHPEAVRAVTFGKITDRDVVVSADDGGGIRIWNLSGAGGNRELPRHQGSVGGLAFSELDGRDAVVTAGNDKTIRIWDTAVRRPSPEELDVDIQVRTMTLARLDDRKLVVVGGDDPDLRVIDPSTGDRTILRGHSDAVLAVGAGQLDGLNVVVSGSRDGRVTLWHLGEGAPLARLGGHRGNVRAIALGQIGDRDIVVSGGHDRRVIVWTPGGDGLRPAMSIPTRAIVNALAVSADRQVIAATTRGLVMFEIDLSTIR